MTRDRLKTDQRDARLVIVETAVDEFSRRGYGGTGLGDIAENLGVTKGAIYYHFKKKADILYVIHETFINVLLDRVEERQGWEREPEDEIRAVFKDVLWLMENMRSYVRVFFEEMRGLEQEQFAEVKAKRDKYAQHVADVYRKGVEQGIFRAIPHDLPVFALFGMANWSYQWFREEGPIDYATVADHFAGIFLRGVRVTATT